MRHGCAFRKLSRDTIGRQRMLRSLACHLFEHERIQTTLPRAKELRRYAEKLITLAIRGTAHAKHKLKHIIYKKSIFNKLCGELVERYASRMGGYTRVWRAGLRPSDKSPLSVIELVGNPWDLRKAFDRFQPKRPIGTLQYPKPYQPSTRPLLK